ncbi:MAG: hypothetical protein A2176_13435 [Spirochaetes bacterium RBG_13_51_14]|nr:MAG: hypothetical protein A2176_13435 [Spirochaetes bacterium RBG_13_51_14]
MKTATCVRKATEDDIDSIHSIISSYSEEGILLSRSIDDIGASLENFHVAEVDRDMAGVISFCDYGDHLKEVRSLAVRKNYLRRGIGSALLQKLITELTAANDPRIFVLTYVPAFFEKNGFAVISVDTLPEKIWKDCVNCARWDACSEIALEYRRR